MHRLSEMHVFPRTLLGKPKCERKRLFPSGFTGQESQEQDSCYKEAGSQWDIAQRAVPSPRCSPAEPMPASIAPWFEQLGLINHRNVLSLLICGECWFYGAGTLWSFDFLTSHSQGCPAVGGAQCEAPRRDLARRLPRAHGHRGSCWPRFMPEGEFSSESRLGPLLRFQLSETRGRSFVLCCQTRISC